MSDPVKHLVVIRGVDSGARLVLSSQVKVVGRAQDAHLVLTDRSVSRHHFHVRAMGDGAHVYLCSDASPFIHNGRATNAAHVKVGESLAAGNTLFLVVLEKAASNDPASSSPVAEVTTTSVGSLLVGVAADVYGFAALVALNEALSVAGDAPAIEATLSSWAAVHAACDAVETDAHGAVAATSAEGQSVLEMVTAKGGTKLLVPAPGTATGWLGFVTRFPPARVTDALRRLLVLAAGQYGWRVSQLSLLRAVKDESESFRRQAMGSANAFLGTSAAAQRLAQIIPKLAVSDTTMLLTGESGSGKSFVARLVHEAGPRKAEPFRIINCAAIPENLLESELFGHERGAFTGAVATHLGAFESSARGTLFLDEIGELPLASQTKLLHVLDEKRFSRVGSSRAIDMRARIIAATNRDLEAMIAAGAFRRELFYRISVLKAVVPPLRERGEDLLLLAKQILADLAPTAGRRIEGFSVDALDAIQSYSWPGNVRELRNAIEHALVLGEEPLISAADLSLSSFDVAPEDDDSIVRLPAKLEWLERRAIEAALRTTGGNRTKAAALLGINRNTLHNKMREGGKE